MTAELAIRDVVEQLAAAWNDEDWILFSQLFTEDASYVTAAGLRLSGRRHIGAHLSSKGGGPLPEKVFLKVDSLKLLAADIALVLCSWQTNTNCQTATISISQARSGVITMVARAAGDGWQVVALHNTDRHV